MGATLDLYIDTSTGQLIQGGSAENGSIPTLTRNDAYTLRLRLLEKSSNGAYTDIDSTGASLKVGIGAVDDAPISGTFKLTRNSATSTEIPYNATTSQLLTCISGIAGNASIVGIGDVYLITAATQNTALSFGGDSDTLFPSSSVIINTRRNPATGVYAQQTVRLAQNPAVFSDTFINTPTNTEISLPLITEGGTGLNETYDLKIGSLVLGGLFTLNYGGKSSAGIDPFGSAITLQSALGAVSGIGASNVSVKENNNGGFSIQFVGTLGQQSITTALQLDASGINFLPLKQTTLSLNTAQLDDLFTSSGADTITPTLEIELTQNGSPKTILQSPITIRKDLINTGAAIPAAQSSYYTKAEADAMFVEDSSLNVYATNRELINSNGDTVIDWENEYFGSGATIVSLTNTALILSDGVNVQAGTSTGNQIGTTSLQKIGFYGNTPVTRPDNTGLINALSSLGLISSGVTLNAGSITFPAADLSSPTTLTIYDGVVISAGSTTGLRIGATTSQRLAFYGNTATAQPASVGVISALVNLGLIASSVTLNAGTITFPSVDLSANPIVITDAFNIQTGTTAGTKFGTTTSNKIGFYNTTPIVQPTGTTVVCALQSLGLIATSVTLGVSVTYPLDLRTGTVVVSEGSNFQLGTTTGTKFGTQTSQKLSFYNATPIIQPATTNVVSALVNLGLIASSVTIGIPSNVITDTQYNISTTYRSLFDTSAVTSIAWESRVLLDSTSVTALDYQNRIAYKSTGEAVVNFDSERFGSGESVVTVSSGVIAISSGLKIQHGDIASSGFKILVATAALDFPSVTQNSSSSLTMTVTGASTNDVVLIGLPSVVSDGLSFLGHVPTANQVEVDAVNATNSAINPASATYRIVVLSFA